MRRFLLVLPALCTLIAPVAAQEGRQQGGITVPAYTDEQRWQRLTFLSVSQFTAGIASYKALGKTAEDYGRFLGDLYAPGWGPPNSGSAIRVARGALFNSLSFRGSDGEVVSVHDTAATIRFRRVHVPFFGAQRTLNGVSVDEYDRMFVVLNERICAHLAVRCQLRTDGDWDAVTFTGRGSVAVTAFPRGTYSVALSAEDLPNNAALAGTWEVAWAPNGRFAVRKDGKLQVEGEYELMLDQVIHRNETGPAACPGPGTYRWTVNPTTGALVFGRLADDCDGRFRVMTRRAYTKR